MLLDASSIHGLRCRLLIPPVLLTLARLQLAGPPHTPVAATAKKLKEKGRTVGNSNGSAVEQDREGARLSVSTTVGRRMEKTEEEGWGRKKGGR